MRFDRPRDGMAMSFVLFALVLAAGASTAVAQIGQFPGVMPPTPSPQPHPPPQTPVIIPPTLYGAHTSPNLMMPPPPLLDPGPYDTLSNSGPYYSFIPRGGHALHHRGRHRHR
jgi:hypothetical protein